MKILLMTQEQEKTIQKLFFNEHKTYHALANEAGIGDRPDKFEDLDYAMADQIIRAHRSLED